MLFGMRDAILAPAKMDTIIITPITQARSVVCSTLKPKDRTISWNWLDDEVGTLMMAAYNVKSHVFGSVKASIILFINSKQLFNESGRYWLLLLEVFVFDSRLVFLHNSHSAQVFNKNCDYILWYVERPLLFHPRSKTKHLLGSLETGNCIFVNERRN